MDAKVEAAALSATKHFAARHGKLAALQLAETAQSLFDMQPKRIKRDGWLRNPNHSVVTQEAGDRVGHQIGTAPDNCSVGIGARGEKD